MPRRGQRARVIHIVDAFAKNAQMHNGIGVEPYAWRFCERARSVVVPFARPTGLKDAEFFSFQKQAAQYEALKDGLLGRSTSLGAHKDNRACIGDIWRARMTHCTPVLCE